MSRENGPNPKRQKPNPQVSSENETKMLSSLRDNARNCDVPMTKNFVVMNPSTAASPHHERSQPQQNLKPEEKIKIEDLQWIIAPKGLFV